MIGKLDQKIEIERQVLTPDGSGGKRRSWAPMTSDPSPWAKVTLLAGDEGSVGGAQVARQKAEFVIRARSDLSTTCRIRWGGIVWEVVSIGRPVARALYQKIMATSGKIAP